MVPQVMKKQVDRGRWQVSNAHMNCPWRITIYTGPETKLIGVLIEIW